MSLVTLSDVKTYLGELTTTYDTFLQGRIDLYSDAVEQYCGRKFLQASYTQTFEAQDFESNERVALFTFHYPIITVTEIKEVQIQPTTNDETVITDYTLHKNSGKLQKTDEYNGRKLWFDTYGSTSQVVITYDAGYTDTPLPIKDAIYSLIEEDYNKKVQGVALNFGDNVQRLSIPGVMSIDFDYTLQANERAQTFGMILGNYVNILDLYRSERALVGSIKENYVS